MYIVHLFIAWLWSDKAGLTDPCFSVISSLSPHFLPLSPQGDRRGGSLKTFGDVPTVLQFLERCIRGSSKCSSIGEGQVFQTLKGEECSPVMSGLKLL